MMVNGKNIQVSSLGRFIDSSGKKKTPSPHRQGYCHVEINRKKIWVLPAGLRILLGSAVVPLVWIVTTKS